MYRVLVTIDLPASVLARLTASCEVTRVAGGLGLVASVAAATREQGGHQLLLCSSFETVDLALLEAAGPRLEAVVTVSAGYNHVDTALLARRGLVLATTPGVLEDSCTVQYSTVLCCTVPRSWRTAWPRSGSPSCWTVCAVSGGRPTSCPGVSGRPPLTCSGLLRGHNNND